MISKIFLTKLFAYQWVKIGLIVFGVSAVGTTGLVAVKQISDNRQVNLVQPTAPEAETPIFPEGFNTNFPAESTNGGSDGQKAGQKATVKNSGSSGASQSSGDSSGASSNSSSQDSGQDSGESADQSSDNVLSSCGANYSFFSHSPLDSSNFTGLVPLGNLNPSGHTFPTDHIYFYLTNPNQKSAVYAPGNATVTKISASEHVGQGYTDYSISFKPCSELEVYFLHISSLSQTLQNVLVAPYGWDSTYTTGGSTYRNYGKNVSVSVSAGDQIGTAGGNPGQNALDMGAYDTRTTLNFINPSARQNSVHTVCPIDYYSGNLKTTLMGRFGDYDGDPKRTTEPVCGSIDQDAAETAQGIWLVKGTTKVSGEDPHLALVHNNIYPNKAVFSVGTSMSASGLPAKPFEFYPSGSGLVNRDFDDVRSDGNIYCYQLDGQGWVEGNFTIILQLTFSTALKIEKQSSASCGSGPWTFTGNQSEFVR
ncbi:MAG: Uncharacterized protein CEN89_16 [Candidatus Berkelbacteria bacterium Licking1014_7]|uniref:Uncharacterized protein n=1 Tax=Candidatus Berkelbacteria bacterium Licking1014_7 TaxID=2017147 RepID=A0A554LLG3_9BACT|nr:MAG: Uncharacterized protein CEN89_16 [Candidatus Berkelbacteria bacterium Licking1014_7]